MSLIVARKSVNQIFIVSDTKLTFPDQEVKGLKARPSDGIIKSIIIRSNVAISFAGDVQYAEDTIQTIDENANINDILNALTNAHITSGMKVEFLLCFVDVIPSIIEIKNGIASSVENAWIGDQIGFNNYQRFYLTTTLEEAKKVEEGVDLGAPIPNHVVMTSDNFGFKVLPTYTTDFLKMSNAMDAVIQEGNVESVGGFKVIVVFHQNKFEFDHYWQTYRGIITLTGPGFHHIGLGDAAEGAYSINFFAGPANGSTTGLHLRDGSFGIVYIRTNKGLMRPLVINMDEVDFIDYVFEKYELKPGFTSQDRSRKFSIEGNVAFKNREFEKAIRLLEKVTKYPDELYHAEVLFFKGMSMFALGNTTAATSVLKEAIEIDKSIEAKLYGIMTELKKVNFDWSKLDMR